jgi:hypothetical protein
MNVYFFSLFIILTVSMALPLIFPQLRVPLASGQAAFWLQQIRMISLSGILLASGFAAGSVYSYFRVLSNAQHKSLSAYALQEDGTYIDEYHDFTDNCLTSKPNTKTINLDVKEKQIEGPNTLLESCAKATGTESMYRIYLKSENDVWFDIWPIYKKGETN